MVGEVISRQYGGFSEEHVKGSNARSREEDQWSRHRRFKHQWYEKCGQSLRLNETETETGSNAFTRAFGTYLPESEEPLTEDTVMWVASCTKLVSTVAALQCVEQGLFSLDNPEDVARLLPELAAPDLFQNFDAEKGTFELAKTKRAPTVRELLTHQSGLQYYQLSPVVQAWRASRGQADPVEASRVKPPSIVSSHPVQ